MRDEAGAQPGEHVPGNASRPAPHAPRSAAHAFSPTLRLAALAGAALSAWAIGAADARVQSLVLNTASLSASVTALALPLGAVLAFLLVRTDVPGRKAAMLVLGVLLFVPLYLHAAAWEAGFGVQGWFSRLTGAPPLVDGWRGAVWVHAVAAVPWVVLIAGAGFWLVEPELEEQALLDAGPGTVFLRVTMPGALVSIGVAALWIVIVTAGEITVTDLFVVRTYAEEIYTRTAVGPQPGDEPLGPWPGVALTAWLVLFGLAACARLAPGERPLSRRPRWTFRLGRWRLPAAALVAAALVMVAGVPLASLVYKAGVSVVQTGQGLPVQSWSLQQCVWETLASPVKHAREFRWSLVIGALAATGAVATGLALAWPARRGGWPAAPALAVAAVLLAMPKPVLGLGIIGVLNRPEVPGFTWFYDRSILAPWLALTAAGLPLATLVLWHALRTVPREMLDAAATDGAGPVSRLLLVALPCRLPALGVAWVVALAGALGELGASVLVVPPGVMTLSIKIFNLLHGGVSEFEVAGICLALAGLFAAAGGVVFLLARKWGAEREG